MASKTRRRRSRRRGGGHRKIKLQGKRPQVFTSEASNSMVELAREDLAAAEARLAVAEAAARSKNIISLGQSLALAEKSE